MSTYSPNRRGSIISNCTNDSDIASDKTPISGQPKKLRKQINNDEFKQNYFELNLSTSTGVQVLAFQPGSETTPKKRKRSSRRKSVPAAEEDSNNDSPRIETKQSKKRKQSIAPSVDTPSAEDICFSEDALQAMISSCDHELFENILQSQQQQFNTPNTTSKMEDETPKLEIKSAFNSKLKRNLACSTSNIQTTSSCSFSLKNSPETPNSSSRNRSTSNSLPIHQILNNDSNTIRKRSNSCVSISQLSNNNNNNNNHTTTQSNLASATTHSPPERLMAKEMKLNVYLNLRRESENCGNSQNSPMTCSTPSAGGMSCTTPQPVQDHLVLARGSVMSTSSAPVMAQRFDSNNFSLNNMFRDEVFWTNMDSTGSTAQQPMQAVTDIAPQIDFNTGSNGALTDLACRQYVNSFFAENPRVHNECGGLDPSLFETLFNSVQGSDAFDPTQQILQPTQQPQPTQPQLESSRVIIPELSMDDLQTMDPNQLQSLIDYLARLQSNRQSMQSPDEQNQSGGSSHLDQHVILNQQQQQNELLFDKDEFQDFFQSFN